MELEKLNITKVENGWELELFEHEEGLMYTFPLTEQDMSRLHFLTWAELTDQNSFKHE